MRRIVTNDPQDIRSMVGIVSQVKWPVAEDAVSEIVVSWAGFDHCFRMALTELLVGDRDATLEMLTGPRSPDMLLTKGDLVLAAVEMKLRAQPNWRGYKDKRPCQQCGYGIKGNTYARWCDSCGRMWQIDAYRKDLENGSAAWLRGKIVDASAVVIVIDAKGRSIDELYPSAYGTSKGETSRAPKFHDLGELVAVARYCRAEALADFLQVQIEVAKGCSWVPPQGDELAVFVPLCPTTKGRELLTGFPTERSITRPGWFVLFGDNDVDVFFQPSSGAISVVTCCDELEAVFEALKDAEGLEACDEQAYEWDGRVFRHRAKACGISPFELRDRLDRSIPVVGSSD